MGEKTHRNLLKGKSHTGPASSRARPSRSLLAKRRSANGFTMLELVIVFAVIALFFSLIIPALANTGKQDLTARCVNNLREIGLLSEMFAGDREGFYPVSVLAEVDGAAIEWRRSIQFMHEIASGWDEWGNVPWNLAPYADLPRQTHRNDNSRILEAGNIHHEHIFACPAQVADPRLHTSGLITSFPYSYGPAMVMLADDAFAGPDGTKYRSFHQDVSGKLVDVRAVRKDAVNNPSEKVFLAPANAPAFPMAQTHQDPWVRNEGIGLQFTRHDGGANLLRFDGSVVKVDFGEIANPDPSISHDIFIFHR